MTPAILFAPLCSLALSSQAPIPVRTVEADGTQTASASLTGLTNPMLTGFRLRFLGSDHQVRRLGLRVAGDEVTATVADANGGDDMGMRAHYRTTMMYRPFTAQKSCRGVCTVPVSTRPADQNGERWRLVLVGFSVDVPKNGAFFEDKKLRHFSIRPTADRTSYRVELRDNGTFDYDVTLQYAWVRAAHVAEITVTGGRAANERTQAVKLGRISNAPMAIAGFSVEFHNGDHHLGDLAFERDTDFQYYARFNDSNYDDPMTATLDLVGSIAF